MKNCFFVLLLFLIAGSIYSQNMPQFRNNRYVDKNGRSFTFSEGGRVNGIKNGNPQNGLHNGSYHVTEEEGINYLYNEDGFPFFCAGMVLSE